MFVTEFLCCFWMKRCLTIMDYRTSLGKCPEGDRHMEIHENSLLPRTVLSLKFILSWSIGETHFVSSSFPTFHLQSRGIDTVCAG